MDGQLVNLLLIQGTAKDSELLESVLRAGCPLPIKMECCSTTSDGLKRLADANFDLLLLGIAPENHTAIDTATKIHARYPELPIILLASKGSTAHHTLTLWRGPYECIAREDLTPSLLAFAIRSAINRHVRETHLRRYTLFDQITGALSREAFIVFLDRELKLARRRNQCVLLLAIHTGGLARIADAIGPHARQQVFGDFARVLQADLRETDLIARIGPADFAILLSDAAPGSAQALTERIRKQLLLLTDHPDWLSLNAAPVCAEPSDELSAHDLLTLALKKVQEPTQHAQPC